MSPENKDKAIKITLDDLASISMPDTAEAPAGTQAPAGAKVYGSINAASDPQTQFAEEKGSILLQAWFYLGGAGLLGALLGWGICEPRFVDGMESGRRAWGNLFLVPLIVGLLCLGFGIAESIVERSVKKALIRGDYTALPSLARRGSNYRFALPAVRPSRRGPKDRSPG